MQALQEISERTDSLENLIEYLQNSNVFDENTNSKINEYLQKNSFSLCKRKKLAYQNLSEQIKQYIIINLIRQTDIKDEESFFYSHVVISNMTICKRSLGEKIYIPFYEQYKKDKCLTDEEANKNLSLMNAYQMMKKYAENIK